MPTPAQRVCLLEGSVRCFALGVCSFIPLFGAAFTIAALRTHRRVSRAWPHDWNPAEAYLDWGHALALIGGLLNLALVLGAVAGVLDALAL